MLLFTDYITINGINYIEITDRVAPKIKEKTYYISIYGDVYSKNRNQFMKPWLNCRGYCHIGVRNKDNTTSSWKIHRLIMLIFNYFPGCESLEVNHIDGNKANNSIYNLEWVTGSQNVQHAYDHGLMASGENHRFSTLTEKEVREICEILQSTKKYKNMFEDIASNYAVSKMAILEIAYGLTWTQVSKDYNIDYNDKINHRFSKEEVHQMCQIFCKYKGAPFNVIYNIVVDELNLYDCKTDLYTRINRIYYRNPGNFKSITDQYDF